MPTFCRHGRLEERCPVCVAKAKKASGEAAPRRTSSAPRRPPRTASGGATRTRPGVVVRKEARAAEDGYANELVPGLRATADAARLAEELGFAVARVEELQLAAPGRYGEVARLADEDREEAFWLAFQIAALGPLETDEPWATIDAVRTTWADGADPEPGELPLGPRAGIDRRRGAAATFAAYRAWAQRAGSQEAAFAGDAAWTPQRRFDRAFERLGLPGFGRSPRFELLVLVSRLGLVELEPWTLMYGTDATDPVVVAAKRVFGIGDAINLSRRSSELCAEAGVPAAALDLALRNFGQPATAPRLRAAATVGVDDEVRARVARVLGAAPAPEEPSDAAS
ncbi:hypothetical protein [Paraconexibacter algicola]|uniref:Alpha-glutamyl/putrescinyl thymine pyrophosphorylase clade 3 domain-containing protein n=1 Tax=Paraconexibacter algicola TaxID=2133960 RepID=A0A2T4UF76_9ACTN|nr:hypothetical protein [Paraconexibacter algicola]PTL56420.1 hypothetical protein C7Y72_15770 [Paraconexibacter algicola]